MIVPEILLEKHSLVLGVTNYCKSNGNFDRPGLEDGKHHSFLSRTLIDGEPFMAGLRYSEFGDLTHLNRTLTLRKGIFSTTFCLDDEGIDTVQQVKSISEVIESEWRFSYLAGLGNITCSYFDGSAEDINHYFSRTYTDREKAELRRRIASADNAPMHYETTWVLDRLHQFTFNACGDQFEYELIDRLGKKGSPHYKLTRFEPVQVDEDDVQEKELVQFLNSSKIRTLANEYAQSLPATLPANIPELRVNGIIIPTSLSTEALLREAIDKSGVEEIHSQIINRKP